MKPWTHFWVTVAAVVVGTNVSKWMDREGGSTSVGLAASVTVAALVAALGWKWFRGLQGLDSVA